MDINQNLGNLMKEAQKMQQRMQEAQDQLTKLIVEGESGGGMVKIKMNGRHEVSMVKVAPTLLEEDAEMLEDLIAAAINDVVRKIAQKSQEKISQLTAGLKIPTDLLKDKDNKE